MTSTCAYHPDRPAADRCAQCQHPICEACASSVAGQTVCTACVQKIRARVAAESRPPVSYAPAAVAPPNALRLLLGGGLAVLLGAVGVVVWVLAVSAMHFDISIFAIGVGWLAGWGALKGSGQGGMTVAVIGAVAALLATVAGSYLLSGGHFGWFQWLCVAVGVYEGFIVPRRARV